MIQISHEIDAFTPVLVYQSAPSAVDLQVKARWMESMGLASVLQKARDADSRARTRSQM